MREQIVTIARTWVNTPWKHQGRSRYGLDCVGLLIVVARELGMAVDDHTQYTHEPDTAVLLEHLRKYTTEIPVADAGPGDLVLMAIHGRRQHVGILTDHGLIHAAALYRKVTEHTLSPDWQQAIVKAFRLNGVAA